MSQARRQGGYALITVLVLITFICGLMMLSLTRAELGFRALKERHLAGVALDLAENGVEVQRYLLAQGQPSLEAAPHRETVANLAEQEGTIESYARPLPGGAYEVVSKGEVKNPRTQASVAYEVRAVLAPSEGGGLALQSFAEKKLTAD